MMLWLTARAPRVTALGDRCEHGRPTPRDRRRSFRSIVQRRNPIRFELRQVFSAKCSLRPCPRISDHTGEHPSDFGIDLPGIGPRGIEPLGLARRPDPPRHRAAPSPDAVPPWNPVRAKLLGL